MSTHQKHKQKGTDPDLLRFGRKVRQVRGLADYSQTELSVLMGFSSNSTISMVESGLIGLELKNIHKIAKILGIMPEILLSNEDISDDQMEMHMRYYEIMHNPNDPMRTALEVILKAKPPEK